MGNAKLTPKIRRYGEDDHQVNDDFQLRILTYNIFMRPPGVENDGGDYKSTRLTAFCNEIKSYDIIALQEMFWYLGKKRFNYLVSEAREQGFKYLVKCPCSLSTFKFKVDGGLVILSKYPIIEADWESFIASNSSDSLSEKGVLYVKIDITNYLNYPEEAEKKFYVHVFNTHLQATYKGTEDKSNRTRMKQLKQISDFINTKVSDHFPTILLGDFNINAHNNEEYNYMKNMFVDTDNFQDLIFQKYGKHPYTYGDVDIIDGIEIHKEKVLTHTDSMGCKESLDYIFFGQKINENSFFDVTVEDTKIKEFFVEGYDFTQLSDHYGIETVLSIIPKKTPTIEGEEDNKDSDMEEKIVVEINHSIPVPIEEIDKIEVNSSDDSIKDSE